MASELWGIDCVNPQCNHDSVRGYRLRFRVRPDRYCGNCRTAGAPVSVEEALRTTALDPREPDELELAQAQDWLQCPRGCIDTAQNNGVPAPVRWRYGFERERNDMVFRPHQMQAALSQMHLLGVDDPRPGQFLVESHHSLPPGYDARLLILTQEALPKMALYFRWRMYAGETLSPDNVFQCLFGPNATAAERRAAPERRLTPEELNGIVQVGEGVRQAARLPAEAQVLKHGFAKLRCQHCMQPVPLRALSVLTLREAEKGD